MGSHPRDNLAGRRVPVDDVTVLDFHPLHHPARSQRRLVGDGKGRVQRSYRLATAPRPVGESAARRKTSATRAEAPRLADC